MEIQQRKGELGDMHSGEKCCRWRIFASRLGEAAAPSAAREGVRIGTNTDTLPWPLPRSEILKRHALELARRIWARRHAMAVIDLPTFQLVQQRLVTDIQPPGGLLAIPARFFQQRLVTDIQPPGGLLA